MFAVIVNPESGKGRTEGLPQALCRVLEESGHESRIFPTQEAGDEGRQARIALENGAQAIVCVGGDGTLSGIVGELAEKDVPLLIVPAGTDNDFVRAFGLPRDPVRALRAQLDGERAHIDLGTVNGKPFLNVSGSGFDVEVLRKTEELKAVWPGEKAYRKAVAAVLGRYKPMELELSVDGGAFERRRVTIAEFANGQYFGGGMRVAPEAAHDDGLLDVVTVVPVWHGLIPLLLPLFILGIHTRLPLAKAVRARSAVLRCPGMTVNIDGRLERMDEARFGVLPGALCVMRPKQCG